MITRLMVANRAEIASRVFRTCRTLGISTVAIHSDADAGLPYVREADVAVRLPGNTPGETYLDVDAVLAAAKAAGADAIHPGYGFLSENAGFARAVIGAGLTWVGPDPESIDQMGSKIEAKKLMRAAGVPVLEAPDQPTEADLPLLVKASAGGGGRGMRVVRRLADLAGEIAAAEAEAASAFGDGTVFVEPYVERGRHVEVQVVGSSVYGDRDCSVQRRHQKVVEEAPAPGLSEAVRAALHEAAHRAAEAIDYRGAGTVEFLYDPASERFWFLEMNTRLQVEHPVTELVHGVDLVELQLAAAEASRLVAGAPRTSATVDGHAIEVRLYAEDPAADHQPQSGVLTLFEIPIEEGIRVDSGYESGSTVSTHYDAMLAKVVAHAPTREVAARKLAGVLSRARIHGVRTNRDQLVAVLRDERFLAGQVSTDLLPRIDPPVQNGRGSAPRRRPRSPWPSWTGRRGPFSRGSRWRSATWCPRRRSPSSRATCVSSGGADPTVTSSRTPRWSRSAPGSWCWSTAASGRRTRWPSEPPEPMTSSSTGRVATPRCGVRRGSSTRPTLWPAAACWRRCPAPWSASPWSRASRSRPASRCWSSRR